MENGSDHPQPKHWNPAHQAGHRGYGYLIPLGITGLWGEIPSVDADKVLWNRVPSGLPRPIPIYPIQTPSLCPYSVLVRPIMRHLWLTADVFSSQRSVASVTTPK